MSDLGFEIEEIARLIKMVEQRGLSELIVEEDDCRVVIRGESYARRHIAASAAAPVATETAGGGHEFLDEEDVSAAPPAPAEPRIPILSPMVGVFYRSAAPDTAPYVEVGDRVDVGQTIGMIEAMKVFSEVPSEHAGRVVEIAVENGQLVRPQEPVIYLSPD